MSITAALLISLVAFVTIEFLWIKFNGSPIPRPDISNAPDVIGSGKPLTFAVLGDSTAVSQGGLYERGYAKSSALHLSKNYTVTWRNFAVSGARAKDVETMQAIEAAKHKPDIVLVAVGANDVTHLTGINSVHDSLLQTINTLRQANKDVKIVLTGSPDMGSVPRLPQPARWFAGKRTVTVNEMVVKLAEEQQVTFAPIAAKTGPTFRQHPELFAGDKFHPLTEGYDIWTPVITDAIDIALKQPL